MSKGTETDVIDPHRWFEELQNTLTANTWWTLMELFVDAHKAYATGVKTPTRRGMPVIAVRYTVKGSTDPYDTWVTEYRDPKDMRRDIAERQDRYDCKLLSTERI